MIYVIIIIAIFLIVFIMFQTDKQKQTNVIKSKGGLKSQLPNFVRFCEAPLSIYEERQMQFVLDAGDRIEYKTQLKAKGHYLGDVYLGINKLFTIYLYCYFITKDGKKINGYQKEIKIPKGYLFREPQEHEYSQIFDDLISGMLQLKEIQGLVPPNNLKELDTL